MLAITCLTEDEYAGLLLGPNRQQTYPRSCEPSLEVENWTLMRPALLKGKLMTPVQAILCH